MDKEQKYRAAQDQAERTAKENTESWAAAVYELGTPNVARFFASIGEFEPLAMVSVMQEFIDETGMPEPSIYDDLFEPSYLTPAQHTIYTVWQKIDAAWSAQRAVMAAEWRAQRAVMAAKRTQRLQDALNNDAPPAALAAVLGFATKPVPVEDA